MKKKWKITIWVIVALLVGVAAYGTYIFKFKEYDVADDEVSEIVSDPYEVELPDGSKLVIGEDGTVSTNTDGKITADSETETDDEDSDSNSSSQSNSTAGVTPPKNSSEESGSADKGSTGSIPTSGDSNKTSTKPTVAEVKAKYETVLNQLEGQADSKINSLIGRAKKEYSDKKANGESIKYGYFFNKYMGAANTLEANTDTVFYGVIKAVEAELVANGYSKTHAKSFVDHYETTKKTRRDSILKKVAGRS